VVFTEAAAAFMVAQAGGIGKGNGKTVGALNPRASLVTRQKDSSSNESACIDFHLRPTNFGGPADD